jgi:hypothetical protein
MVAALHSSPIQKSIRAALLSALALTPLFAMNEASACAACGCSLSKDWESQGISSKTGFTFDLSYDYLNQNQQRYGTGAASDALINSQLAAGQEVEAYTKTQTITASLIYNDDTWGVAVQLPYAMRSHDTYGATAPLGSSNASSADTSLGDIKVIGRYNGFSSEKTWGLIAGVKLPTGNTSAYFKDGVSPLDAGLQIGTGTTDIIYGAYTTGSIDTLGWFVQGTVQHAIAAKNGLQNLDYRAGDTYSLNTGIRYAGFGAKVSPMLQLNIIKRVSDTGAPDPTSGLSSVPNDPVTGAPVSGGTLAYLAPGVSVRVGGGTSVYGFVQIPVFQDVSSLQITPSYTATIGVRQSFE